MWISLDSGSVMFALRHGVGQYGVRANRRQEVYMMRRGQVALGASA